MKKLCLPLAALATFLLMSASFLHLKAINTSVPVQAESSAGAPAEPFVEAFISAQREPMAQLAEALE